jgi:hypothetical protein
MTFLRLWGWQPSSKKKLSAGYGRSDVIHGIDIEVPKGRVVCRETGTPFGMMHPRIGYRIS